MVAPVKDFLDVLARGFDVDVLDHVSVMQKRLPCLGTLDAGVVLAEGERFGLGVVLPAVQGAAEEPGPDLDVELGALISTNPTYVSPSFFFSFA